MKKLFLISALCAATVASAQAQEVSVVQSNNVVTALTAQMKLVQDKLDGMQNKIDDLEDQIDDMEKKAAVKTTKPTTSRPSTSTSRPSTSTSSKNTSSKTSTSSKTTSTKPSTPKCTDTVCKAYREVYGREPDKAGYDFWKGELNKGMSSAEFNKKFLDGARGTQDCAKSNAQGGQSGFCK